MRTLVLGASGATGRHVVEQLLANNEKVKVIVRSADALPESWKRNDHLSIVEAGVSQIPVNEMTEYLKECEAVVSCLGHNLTFKGLFGRPRRLVADAVDLVCNAIVKTTPERPVRIVLMSSSGIRNKDINEPISFGQKLVVVLLRLLLPPHVDNEKAADYLRTKVGRNHKCISWVAVRPDGLINEDTVTPYKVVSSPERSAIFDAGSVSRINVGHFMAQLITDHGLWKQWRGQMPVIYSASEQLT